MAEIVVKMAKIKTLTWILIAVGLVYTLLPHSLHMQYSIDFGLQHSTHLMIGVGALIGAYFNHKNG